MEFSSADSGNIIVLYAKSKLLAYNGKLVAHARHTSVEALRFEEGFAYNAHDGTRWRQGCLRYVFFEGGGGMTLCVPNYILACPVRVDVISHKFRRIQRWFKTMLRRRKARLGLAMAMAMHARLGERSPLALLPADCVMTIAGFI
jgi:hypothetical protein